MTETKNPLCLRLELEISDLEFVWDLSPFGRSPEGGEFGIWDLSCSRLRKHLFCHWDLELEIWDLFCWLVSFKFFYFFVVSDLFKGFGFNLANSLTGNGKNLAYFFQSMGDAVVKAEAHR